MIPKKYFLAIDLGSSNGSIMIGVLDGNGLVLREAHRFQNTIIQIDGKKHWDWDFLKQEIWKGLSKACQETGNEKIESVCCSSWAQDFCLLNKRGELFYKPVSYRDKRTQGLPYGFSETISAVDLWKRNGSAISPITSLCQLYAIAHDEPEALEQAEKLLFIADLVNYMLCGEAVTDWTFATASQMINIRSGAWDVELVDKLGIPKKILPKVNGTPQVIGKITCHDIHPKLKGVPVVSGAGHDTAVASLTVFKGKRKTAFLSLGTWAMLGCYDEEINLSRIDDYSISVLGLPGEKWGAFCSSVGLWLIQECVRKWVENDICTSYKELAEQAVNSTINSIIAVKDDRFFSPGDMVKEIVDYCKETDQVIPEKPEDFAKVIFDSLANEFRILVEKLKKTCGVEFEKVQVVSGGAKNKYLCSKISEVVGIPVIAGPAEATSIGNIILQAEVMNALKDETGTVDIIRNSFSDTDTYEN